MPVPFISRAATYGYHNRVVCLGIIILLCRPLAGRENVNALLGYTRARRALGLRIEGMVLFAVLRRDTPCLSHACLQAESVSAGFCDRFSGDSGLLRLGRELGGFFLSI
jgi:hypothetical protein